MDTTCAVVRISDGLVINLVSARPSDEPPNECVLVEIMANQPYNMGWYWNGVEFIDPNPSPWSDTEA